MKEENLKANLTKLFDIRFDSDKQWNDKELIDQLFEFIEHEKTLAIDSAVKEAKSIRSFHTEIERVKKETISAERERVLASVAELFEEYETDDETLMRLKFGVGGMLSLTEYGDLIYQLQEEK